MADDWIKIRTAIRKHPKTIAMAGYLATSRPFMNWLTHPVHQSCKETTDEHVTRSVTLRVTQTALIDIWSAAREFGKREGVDCVFHNFSLSDLDDIAEIPGVGEAMEYAGWAQTDDGDVRLPNFFDFNRDREDKREQAAERKRRQRDRERDSHARDMRDISVTVTPESHGREEKRRVEKSREEDRGRNPPITPSCTVSKNSETVLNETPPAGTILTFPTEGRTKSQDKVWHLSPEQLQEWQVSFPHLDVLAECRHALAWVNASCDRKKTAKGMPRFLVGWLGRAQDRGRGRKPVKQETAEERRRRILEEQA